MMRTASAKTTLLDHVKPTSASSIPGCPQSCGCRFATRNVKTRSVSKVDEHRAHKHNLSPASWPELSAAGNQELQDAPPSHNAACQRGSSSGRLVLSVIAQRNARGQGAGSCVWRCVFLAKTLSSLRALARTSWGAFSIGGLSRRLVEILRFILRRSTRILFERADPVCCVVPPPSHQQIFSFWMLHSLEARQKGTATWKSPLTAILLVPMLAADDGRGRCHFMCLRADALCV